VKIKIGDEIRIEKLKFFQLSIVCIFNFPAVYHFLYYIYSFLK